MALQAPAVPALPSLTDVRFPAALAIVLFHECGLAFAGSWILRVTGTFYAAVSFFFVLSGFVLTWSWSKPRSPGFLRRRITRILPVHLVFWIALFVHAGYQAPHTATDWTTFALGIVLLQSWSVNLSIAQGLNAPAWSLSCEAAFYVFFPYLVRKIPAYIPNPRRYILGLMTLVLAAFVVVRLILATAGVAATGPSQISYVFPLYRLPEFILGIVLARAVQSGWRPSVGPRGAAIVLGAGLVVVAVCGYGFPRVFGQPLPFDVTDDLVMVPAGYLIAALAAYDLANPRERPRGSLGQLGLSLYLCSWLIQVLLGIRLPTHQGGWTAAGEVLLVVLVDLALAVAARAVVEIPGARLLSALLLPPGRRLASTREGLPEKPLRAAS